MADMPLLLAPVPFVGATLHQLQPQVTVTDPLIAATPLKYRSSVYGPVSETTGLLYAEFHLCSQDTMLQSSSVLVRSVVA